MRIGTRAIAWMAVLSMSFVAPPARADVMTADQAVQFALKNSSSAIAAKANVLSARGGVQGAYAGVLPHVSLNVSRSGSQTDQLSQQQFFASTVGIPYHSIHDYRYSTTPALNGTWNVLNLSSLSNLSSAKHDLQSFEHSERAARNDVALDTKRLFYEVVKAIKLEDVASATVKLSRDNEKRVRALFEVGSVSRSDVLRAQVNTSQSELDSLVKRQGVLSTRVTLAQQLGIEERTLGDVDTTLGVQTATYDVPTVLAEAKKQRPDIQAAELEVKSAQLAERSAKFLRLPYLTVNGFYDYNPSSDMKSVFHVSPDTIEVGHSKSDRSFGGTVALNWNVFDGMNTDAQISAARARRMRADDALGVLTRGLEGEVREAIAGYETALEGETEAESAVASAQENLKLTQQKYNVGSATILDLIDAQVSLARAQSDQVSAAAAIRVAAAIVDRVRGAQP